MISRIWHGWTTTENADDFEFLLRTQILPGIRWVRGYKGAYLLRHEAEDEVEFVTITLWDSLEEIQIFAGDEYHLAVVRPEMRKLLTRFDTCSMHYETVMEPYDVLNPVPDLRLRCRTPEAG